MRTTCSEYWRRTGWSSFGPGASWSPAGVIEQPLVFDANDRPGVMLAEGARRLARLYGVKPGERAVVATMNNEGYAAALELHDVGVSIAALVDSRSEPARDAAVDAVRATGIPILAGHAVTRGLRQPSRQGGCGREAW